MTIDLRADSREAALDGTGLEGHAIAMMTHAPVCRNRIRNMYTDLRIALMLTIGAAVTIAPALEARQTPVPSVQYRSPEGVEYRSLADSDAVKTARTALEA